MFCLTCGAELSLRAASCPVCGYSLSPSTDTAETPRVTFSTSPTASSARLATPASASFQTGLPVSFAPRTGANGLRGTAGRVLLLTAIGLAADLFAPWSIVYGQQKTMAGNHAPAVALLALFALAVLPLLRPDFRARPLFAVAPLVVGAFCLGAGIFYWAILGRENAINLAQTQVGQLGWSNNGSVPPGAMVTLQPVVAPGLGLYLFLIGGAVLAVAGYQLFLQAALASARAAITPAVQPASPTRSSVPAPASMPLVTPITPTTPTAALAAASSPHAAESASVSQPHPASAPSIAPTSTRPAASATKPVVLPGSAAWNEPSALPTYTRPARTGNGGWSRQAGARR